MIKACGKPDYQKQLAKELGAIRDSEMWRAGAAVRALRPAEKAHVIEQGHQGRRRPQVLDHAFIEPPRSRPGGGAGSSAVRRAQPPRAASSLRWPAARRCCCAPASRSTGACRPALKACNSPLRAQTARFAPAGRSGASAPVPSRSAMRPPVTTPPPPDDPFGASSLFSTLDVPRDRIHRRRP